MSEQIDTHEVYKQIKKRNGEHFARVLRDEGLLDIPNLIHIVEYAGKEKSDAIDLIGYLRHIQYKEKNLPLLKQVKYTDPIKLLDLAGYNAFYVENLKQQNSIKKYFKPNEELCTFKDSSRYKEYYIIHAVKKDVDEIKREYFTYPQRQDRYGTSVISIQIAKDGSRISIKNRYNDTVENPDATFDNNPDNIIPGLTYSLQKHFDISFTIPQVPLPNNFILLNNQIVRYNIEVNNVHVDNGYYVDNNTIQHIIKDYEVQMDHFVLNTRTGEVRDIVKNNAEEGFVKIFNNEIAGKKITLKRNGKETIIFANNEEIARTESGNLTALTLNNCTHLSHSFLVHNKTLKTFTAQKLKQIGVNCLPYNEALAELNVPELKNIGDYFLSMNNAIAELNLPELESIGDEFLAENKKLKTFIAPKLKTIGNSALFCNEELVELNLPELESMGGDILAHNQKLRTFVAPKLQIIENDFLDNNEELVELNLPELKTVGERFLYENKKLKTFNAPKLQKIGENCLINNKKLTLNDLPEVMRNTPDSLPLKLRKILQLKNGITQIKSKSKDFTNRITRTFAKDDSIFL